MYNSWVYSGFNFALGLPIIFYGIMDQDIPYDFALANPKVKQLVNACWINARSNLFLFLS